MRKEKSKNIPRAVTRSQNKHDSLKHCEWWLNDLLMTSFLNFAFAFSVLKIIPDNSSYLGFNIFFIFFLVSFLHFFCHLVAKTWKFFEFCFLLLYVYVCFVSMYVCTLHGFLEPVDIRRDLSIPRARVKYRQLRAATLMLGIILAKAESTRNHWAIFVFLCVYKIFLTFLK